MCFLPRLFAVLPVLLFPFTTLTAQTAEQHRLDGMVQKMTQAYRDHNDSLLLFTKEAAQLALQLKNYSALLVVYKIQGNYYFLSGNYNQALLEYSTGIRIGEEQHLGAPLVTLYYEIAGVYSKNGNKSLSSQNVTKGLHLAEKIKDTSGLADGHNRLGIYLERDGMVDTALFCYHKSYELYAAINDSIGMSYSLENEATAYGQKKRYAEAIDRIKRSLRIREMKNDRYGIAIATINTSEIYQQAGQIDSAIKYALLAEKAALAVSFPDLVQYTYEQLYRLYKLKNKPDLALLYHERHTRVKDSIFNAERTRQLSEFSTRFDTERKEQQIKVLNKQKTIQRLGLFVSILLLLIMIVIAYLIFKTRKQKEAQLRSEAAFQLQLKEADARNAMQQERLRISRELHDNIGAHLTFINATVDNLAQDNTKVQQVKELTNDTIRELRKTVWLINKSSVKMDEFVIKLREFLKNIPRLSISADVSDHEVVLHAELITELFRAIQESVNNALKYADAENITVSIVADSNNIAVRIADNGCGFDPQQKAKGFGLENMQYRMKSIGGSYELYSAPGKGTTVVLQAHLG